MRDGLASKNIAENLYPFVQNPGQLKAISFGVFNLGTPNVILAIVAGIAQFFQAKMFSQKNPPSDAGQGAKDESMAAAMNKQMLYVMPVMTALIGFRLPAGLTLYWIFSTLLMIAQQVIIFRRSKVQVQPEAK
jgi:YidC/Oxa1 family membrane protein insertase